MSNFFSSDPFTSSSSPTKKDAPKEELHSSTGGASTSGATRSSGKAPAHHHSPSNSNPNSDDENDDDRNPLQSRTNNKPHTLTSFAHKLTGKSDGSPPKDGGGGARPPGSMNRTNAENVAKRMPSSAFPEKKDEKREEVKRKARERVDSHASRTSAGEGDEERAGEKLRGIMASFHSGPIANGGAGKTGGNAAPGGDKSTSAAQEDQTISDEEANGPNSRSRSRSHLHLHRHSSHSKSRSRSRSHSRTRRPHFLSHKSRSNSSASHPDPKVPKENNAPDFDHDGERDPDPVGHRHHYGGDGGGFREALSKHKNGSGGHGAGRDRHDNGGDGGGNIEPGGDGGGTIDTEGDQTGRGKIDKGKSKERDRVPDAEFQGNRLKGEESLTEAQESQRKYHSSTFGPARNTHPIEDASASDSCKPDQDDGREYEEHPTKREVKKGEAGNVPPGLPGIKREEKPGNRNEIHLKPRVPRLAFHVADEHDLNYKKSNVPLVISADGEAELLPSGKMMRHGPDQNNELVMTREQEKEIIPDGNYGDKGYMAKTRAHSIGDDVRDQFGEQGGVVDGPGDGNGEEEEDSDVGTLDNTVGGGTWRSGSSARGGDESSSGVITPASSPKRATPTTPNTPTDRIPKADHEKYGPRGLLSSRDSSGGSRPKGGRIWSSFRKDDSPAPKVGGSSPAAANGNGKADGSRWKSPINADADNAQGVNDGQGQPEAAENVGKQKWAVLRQKLLRGQTGTIQHATPATVPVTNELLAGQLPVMIMKTWLGRDEHGNRAVPVLLGNLRFRVGDSAGLGGGATDDEKKEDEDGQGEYSKKDSLTGKEVFRIECEYGDGAVKWVIYRELRDFVSLHGHYRAENLKERASHLRSQKKVEIPEFPRIILPYLNRINVKLEKEERRKLEEAKEQAEQDAKKMSRKERSRKSRLALQQYLVELIRAVMFRPESNRLCRFFELSAMTLSLAPRGGFQGKAGFLKVLGGSTSKRGNQPGLMPTTWRYYRAPKWWIVRESYFMATDGPEATEIYEVFLIDQDFSIERPKRILRQGLNKLTGHGSVKTLLGIAPEEGKGGSGNAQADRQAAIAASAGSGQLLADDDDSSDKGAAMNENDGRNASQHTFYITNSQRRLRLVARNVRQMQQFIISMERVATRSIWQSRNRFDSFAPIRMNVAAQWLVDGRDYFWNLSRAMNMAKERIYIHDWWISPELYLRRPGNERYRLDNLLKRKAEEGVKVFIIIYNEVSNATTPVDSTYVKKRLSSLHPNIMVQRSPSHFQTGTFYWSHHEKLCVIDETIAFMGGLDLCYGRWDTSQHVMIDDDFEPGATGENGPIWPGKDMANERVVEFHDLNKPFEDSFDRTKIPRMPWHDVGLQIVGQPARDLCRHFVQRWNHLIRTKNHTRPMPFLLPPADYTDLQLQNLRLQGTCEVQICRSCGPWSMGTPTKVEHSIGNAYLKAIQLSEHFVYIENQFFITSTVVDSIVIENAIGDALVDRIIRAHKSDTPWRACIVIPLLPGYTYPIDTAEASSVRLILECQNRTISRGAHSIFSRLRKEGIDPNDHITFFSLRGWGKFKTGALTTEQVYIHGKTMVVDDRLVICGSANINERSQRGDRDSELAAVVRDTDMIDSTMAGKPFKVGRYAHTLRMRLMREHLGVDVDALEEDELMNRKPVAHADELQRWDPDHEQDAGETSVAGVTTVKKRSARDRFMMTVEDGLSSVTKGVGENAISNIKKAADVVIQPISVVAQHNSILTSGNKTAGDDSERQDFDSNGKIVEGFADSVVPTLEEATLIERRPSASHTDGKPLFDALDDGEGQGKDDVPEARIPKEQMEKMSEQPVDSNGKDKKGSSSAPRINAEADQQAKFGAPANAVADDDEVPTRNTKRSNASTQEQDAVKARKTLRKHLDAKVGTSPYTMPTPTPKIYADQFADPLKDGFWKDQWVATAVHNTEIYRKVFRCIPDDLITSWQQYKNFASHAEKFNKVPQDVAADKDHEPVKVTHDGGGTHGAGGGGSGGGIIGQGGTSDQAGTKHNDVGNGHSSSDHDPRENAHHRKPTAPDEAFAQWEREEMEILLGEVRGHLVVYPTRFLEAEDLAGNFLFNSDKILPLPIYD